MAWGGNFSNLQADCEDCIKIKSKLILWKYNKLNNRPGGKHSVWENAWIKGKNETLINDKLGYSDV